MNSFPIVTEKNNAYGDIGDNAEYYIQTKASSGDIKVVRDKTYGNIC
jgi:hypothetical protein